MSLMQVRRCPGGFFGKLALPGTRDLIFRFNTHSCPGSDSVSLYFSLFAKIQPDNALELAIRRARDSLGKVIGEPSHANGSENSTGE